MNRYEPDTPRAAFGIAAIALTAIVLGSLVIAPATMDSRSDAALILARFNGHDATPPVNVGIFPARIDVVGVQAAVPTRSLDVTTAGMHMTATGLLATDNAILPAAAQTANVVAPITTLTLAGNGKPDCKPAS